MFHLGWSTLSVPEFGPTAVRSESEWGGHQFDPPKNVYLKMTETNDGVCRLTSIDLPALPLLWVDGGGVWWGVSRARMAESGFGASVHRGERSNGVGTSQPRSVGPAPVYGICFGSQPTGWCGSSHPGAVDVTGAPRLPSSAHLCDSWLWCFYWGSVGLGPCTNHTLFCE